MIIIRQATPADAKNLWKWKNNYDMRRFSIKTTKLIRYQDHLDWLKNHLRYICVIEYFDLPVGSVRVEHNEISIMLDEDYRGRGIAYEALESVKRNGLIAKIVDGNVASMRLFIKGGFKPIKHKQTMRDGKLIGYYILKYEKR
jgi:RimJ/RimL family protein N-acetyltransferase